ncbi:MAG: amino acid ABC transporter ATP-binding protein [Lactobacillaceae bacterium]|jgi:putative glutamine transport system ATP-binding protein|nr:amino acid ABC transporter ATP-binding protein [Lactobacillaceae bacterium]
MTTIKFDNVEKYYGNFHALKNINLTIKEGETVVIIGPSGSGKSTLIRTINGLEAIQAGHLYVDDQDVADPETDITQVRQNVGMVFQQFNLYNNKTVLENVMLAPRVVLKRDAAENKAVALKLLDQMEMCDWADKMPASLSSGQKQRVALARSLAMQPKAMLFDEPTSALDPEMSNDVLQIMHDIVKNSAMTIVVVTHEMGFARQVADRVIFMADGEIVEDAPADEFFNHPKDHRAKMFVIYTEAEY